MRITINLDDDAVATASACARARGLELGAAVSQLIRCGAADRLPLSQVDGIWVVDLPADAAPLRAREVRQMLDASA
jgi:hypothetical protein